MIWGVPLFLETSLSCPHIQCTGRPVVVLKQWIFRTIRSCGFPPQDAGGDCGYPSAYDGVAWLKRLDRWQHQAFYIGVQRWKVVFSSLSWHKMAYKGIYAWIQVPMVPCFFFRSPINSLSIWIGKIPLTCFSHIIVARSLWWAPRRTKRSMEVTNEFLDSMWHLELFFPSSWPGAIDTW